MYHKMPSLEFALEVIKYLPTSLKPVGSVLRKSAKVNDIDFITTETLESIEKKLKTIQVTDLKITKVKGDQLYNSYNINYKGKAIKMDIWKTTPQEKPFALLARSGTPGYNIGLRKIAKERGLMLTDKALITSSGQAYRGIKTVRDIYKILNKPYRKPEDRQ